MASTDETLGKIELFSGLSDRELKSISKLMTPVRVEAGKVLTREGEPGREFMIITKGEASVTRDGKRLATLGPGDFFGELAVIGGVPRTATVTAESEMTVEAMNRAELSSLLDEAPKIAKKILIAAVQHLHSAGSSDTA